MELKVSGKNLRTNKMLPIRAEINLKPMGKALTSLAVPFDNDTFISYDARPIKQGEQSFSAEVTALYDNKTTQGLIMGSLDQADWKTGVKTELNEHGVRMDAECGFTSREETEDVNVSRMLSAVVTGTLIVGDDFSQEGPWKAKAAQFFQQPELLDILKDGKAFRPVEGGLGKGASNIFQKQVDKVKYIAIFNYENEERSYPVDFVRLGISGNRSLDAKELISGETKAYTDHSVVKLKAAQAIMLKITVTK